MDITITVISMFFVYNFICLKFTKNEPKLLTLVFIDEHCHFKHYFNCFIGSRFIKTKHVYFNTCILYVHKLLNFSKILRIWF